MPPATKYVGRPGPLGNPFIVGSKAERAAAFRRAFYAGELPITENDIRSELEGYTVCCCWCREDEPCHADVYVGIMNAA